MTAFQRLFEALQGHESGELPATLRKDVGRFRVWAENSGAHRRDRMSLEYRLREASGVKQMVIKLLGDIHTNVEEGK
jgi:hypothetical protein